MLFLLGFLIISLTIIYFKFLKKNGSSTNNLLSISIIVCDFISFLIISFFLIGCTCTLIEGRNIPEKIVMYQEMNSEIESEMYVLVKQYMQYESDTYKDFKPESSIKIVSLNPELKSDTLIQGQVYSYIDNNSNIKRLKEEKINLSMVKWWLYFGR